MSSDNRYQAEPPSSGELVRSMALSSAELWHEILERLREVQESQARLAVAIEGLSVMFRDAIAPDDQPIVGAHSKGASLARGEPPTFRTPPAIGSEASSAPDRSLASGSPDAVASIGTDVRSGPDPDPGESPFPFKGESGAAETSRDQVAGSAANAGSQNADVSDPAFSADVPEPLFYVPPLGENVLTLSAVVDLTPSALDAVLAAEFADATRPAVDPQAVEAPADPGHAQSAGNGLAAAPDVEQMLATANGARTSEAPARRRVLGHTEEGTSKTDPNEVLDILLGTPKGATTTAHAHDETSASPADGASSAFDVGSSDPSSPRPLLFEAMPPPPPPPPVVEAAPPPLPVFDVTSPPPVAFPPPPPPVVESPPPELVFEAAPQTPVVESPPEPVFDVTPATPVVESPPPEPVFEAAPVRPDTDNDVEALEEGPGATDEPPGSEDAKPYSSAVSLASEILSATPESPEPEGEPEAKSSLISEDMTLIARGRRKRFRMR